MLSLLLPVDGSDASERAVKHAVELISHGLNARVLLLNVQPLMRRSPNRKQRRADMVGQLEQFEKALRRATTLLVRAAVVHKRSMQCGPPADSILEFAREHDCDAIMMGTRGLGAVAGLVLGSVAIKVVQLSRIPVTLVR
jgi:nucleotide-binding universal stress UspA family protein